MPERNAKFYIRQLELADKDERQYRIRAKKVVKRYKDDKGQDSPTRFNILWSNTQTQLPAMYSARPKPDVRRRWRSPNKVGREIAKAVERCLEFSMDSYDFDREMEKLVLDFLLPGRSVPRVKYHPVIIDREVEEPAEQGMDGAVEKDDGSFVFHRKFKEKVHEEVRMYHVPYKYYRYSPADCWQDVWWVAYGDNFLTLDELADQFFEGDTTDAMRVPRMFTDADEATPDETGDEIKRAQVWELWDKEAKQVVAVVKGYDELLMQDTDPLRLGGFFPQPEPAMMIESPDSLEPIPEYTMYQFQAEELNSISQRIADLTKSMKLVGFYPGEDAAKMNELMKSSDGILVPVDNWAAFAEKGGVKGMIDWLPIKEAADVWQRLLVQREALTQQIFELVGISDIQRGATDPRETRGAQQLKANFGKRRLLPKQQRLQRMIRDVLRIKAEIIAEHFDPKTISRMAGMEVTDDMLAIMRADALRNFTIDVETDSTVAPDSELEKQGVAEFLSAMGGYLGQSMPLVAENPAAVEPLGKILLWMTRKFKIARDVEDEIEDFIERFRQMPQQQDSKVQAEMQELQAKLQLKQQEVEATLRLKEAEMKREQQRKDLELQADIRREDFETNADVRRKNAEANNQPVKGQTFEGTVVPIRKNFNMIRGEDGKVQGAEMTENGVTKRLTFQRDEQGNIIGGDVSA